MTSESIGKTLEELASANKTITYAKLAEMHGLPAHRGDWRGHPLSQIFEILDQADARNSRPFRTALVVSAAGNRPGAGFFEALERLRNIVDPVTDGGRDAVWMAELNSLFKYYR